MTIARSRTFLADDGEAIHVPAEVAFGADVDLLIVRSGDVMTIYPASLGVGAMIERMNALAMPPQVERRDDEEIPERPGL